MRSLKFNVYDEFACTGPECDDTCCRYWRILLTKREYLDFKKMDCSPELRAVLDSAFKRIKSGNDYQYAKVEFREDGTCPLLGEDRLCMLQKEKGESALTCVCSAFPRNWAQIGSTAISFTLTPTCYHVVELLMKHPEGLVLTEEEYDGKNRWLKRNKFTASGLEPGSEMLPYVWTIKTAQLDILQNRDFTIAERLLILGYYTQKAGEYLKNSPEKLNQLGAMMLDKELTAKIADSLKTPQSEEEAITKSADILFKLTDYMRRSEPESYLTELLGIIADSVELKYEPTGDGSNNIYFSKSACIKNREIYSKIEEERSYITENLLATLAFAKFSTSGGALWDDYFSLVVLYNLLKTGAAAFLPENFTDKELAMAITNMVKLLLNSGLAKEVTARDFFLHGISSLSYVAFLIS